MRKKKVYLSNTSIKTFMACKKRYKYKHIDRISMGDSVSNKYMSFGNSIHITMADFNMLTNSQHGTLDVLHNLLRKNWIRDGYESKEEERTFGLRGLDMLSLYYDNPLDIGSKNLLIEEMIFKEMEHYVLCGKLDKVYMREDEVIEIIDYKTGKSISPIDQIQLPVYLILAESNLGIYPGAVSLYFLAQNEKVTQELDSRFIDTSTQFIYDLCDLISNEKDFSSSPNCNCKTNCEFYSICEDAKTTI
ncbi:CRISPR/Cas system-associated exonuclease Cas4 (RecB family) [Anaerosolibacter carboniphilus]|uniref:CRISPR/Cas system-associated exonuclease Cas4 (RecB family) n=1 Tax=Anaerosolibacter carboniphilus TaxID=1417629 RepID=A0A841L748_9FIRM|nr:PD-(D/E)XK nuclease family protein [Anaerosolibacter carboniphilus]MBB6218095.1 CRISPR/Cas system-associated exonuclease Cas4 (RecB family) [Anaerosolibacter carboniphilus]